MSRYTVDFSKDFDKLLSELADMKSMSKAEIIRRAVASYAFLDKQAPRSSDKKISITDKNDKVIKDIVLP